MYLLIVLSSRGDGMHGLLGPETGIASPRPRTPDTGELNGLVQTTLRGVKLPFRKFPCVKAPTATTATTAAVERAI